MPGSRGKSSRGGRGGSRGGRKRGRKGGEGRASDTTGIPAAGLNYDAFGGDGGQDAMPTLADINAGAGAGAGAGSNVKLGRVAAPTAYNALLQTFTTAAHSSAYSDLLRARKAEQEGMESASSGDESEGEEGFDGEADMDSDEYAAAYEAAMNGQAQAGDAASAGSDSEAGSASDSDGSGSSAGSESGDGASDDSDDSDGEDSKSDAEAGTAGVADDEPLPDDDPYTLRFDSASMSSADAKACCAPRKFAEQRTPLDAEMVAPMPAHGLAQVWAATSAGTPTLPAPEGQKHFIKGRVAQQWSKLLKQERKRASTDALAVKVLPKFKASQKPVLVHAAAEGARAVTLTRLQAQLLPWLSNYTDLYYTVQNDNTHDQLQLLWTMHVASHLVKARSLVLKHNTRLREAAAKRKAAAAAKRLERAIAADAAAENGTGRPSKRRRKGKKADAAIPAAATLDASGITKLEEGEEEDDELKDQGFTRPRVLVLLPFRSSAHRFVTRLLSLLPIKEVHNRKRFEDQFGAPDVVEIPTVGEDGDDKKAKKKKPPPKKPVDHQRLFRDNIDECFKVGVSVTRKSVKLYSSFYHSDLIVASPLGLRLVTGAAEDEKRDIDFLSSIEVVVVDQADVLAMQNWEHVVDALQSLNAMPAKDHGTDFSRVREWNLNGFAKHYRQTLLFTSGITAESNALMRQACANVKGAVQVRARYAGAVTRVVLQVRQVFHRISAATAADVAEARFDFFCKHLLPQFANSTDSAANQAHTLVFVPSYFDYVRIRNILTDKEASYSACCEYTADAAVSRARSDFFHDRVDVMLYTERFHFYRRYRVRGIRHILFYAPPATAQFYAEMLNLLQEASDQSEAVSCVVLYSKYDSFAMERIVGTERAARMITSPKSMFMLC